MKRTLASFILAATSLVAGPNALVDGRIANVQDKPSHRAYWASVATMVVGQSLDVASSVGPYYELNPMLRGANGQFSLGKGIAFKAIIVGGVLGAEKVFHSQGKLAEGANYGLAGLGAEAAIHNWQVEGKL